MIFYSPSKKGFFDSSLKDVVPIPNDAIQISEQYHRELLNNQSAGKEISHNEKGYPIAIDRKKTRSIIVSAKNLRIRLLDINKLDLVEEKLNDNRRMKIEWDFNDSHHIESDFIKFISSFLSDDDMKVIFP